MCSIARSSENDRLDLESRHACCACEIKKISDINICKYRASENNHIYSVFCWKEKDAKYRFKKQESKMQTSTEQPTTSAPTSEQNQKNGWKITGQKSKAKKRQANNDMEVEIINGIQGKVKQQSAAKKARNVQSNEQRKISVPAHRYTPLKKNWMKIFTPVVEFLRLQIRFNLKTRNVEIRVSPETTDIAHLQKAADFVKAFIYGFEVEDALALLRLDDLFIESFDIQDVRQQIKGDHRSRAIGRLAGKGGRTKFTIENVTKTRIVVADSRIHILGSFQNIQLARRAICNLILGSPPSKIYGQLRNIASRISEQL